MQPIIGKLVSTIATPSQQVQEAVANCLPPPVPSIKDQAPKLVSELLHTLLTTENYGERKGAAYGLAGLVKGLGILSLKQLNSMTRLTETIQNKKNKKNHKYREAALFALSQLCSALYRPRPAPPPPLLRRQQPVRAGGHRRLRQGRHVQDVGPRGRAGPAEPPGRPGGGPVADQDRLRRAAGRHGLLRTQAALLVPALHRAEADRCTATGIRSTGRRILRWVTFNT